MPIETGRPGPGAATLEMEGPGAAAVFAEGIAGREPPPGAERRRHHLGLMQRHAGQALEHAVEGVSKISVLLDEIRQNQGPAASARPGDLEALMERMEKALEAAREDMNSAEILLTRAVRSSQCE